MTEQEFQNNSVKFSFELVTKLKEKSNELIDGTIEKMTLLEVIQNLNHIVTYSPRHLYTELSNILRNEQGMVTGTATFCVRESIKEDLDAISSKVRNNSEETKLLNFHYEEFLVLLHSLTGVNADLAQAPNDKFLQEKHLEMDHIKNQQFIIITNMRIALVDKFKEVIQKTTSVQDQVIVHLDNWKYVQSKARSGYDMKPSFELNTIQSWFEFLGNIILNTKMQIGKVIELKEKLTADETNLPNFLPELNKQIMGLLEKLGYNSLVIEKQPDQVVQKGHKIDVSLRLLAGNILNIQNNETKIQASVECGK